MNFTTRAYATMEWTNQEGLDTASISAQGKTTILLRWRSGPGLEPAMEDVDLRIAFLLLSLACEGLDHTLGHLFP